MKGARKRGIGAVTGLLLLALIAAACGSEDPAAIDEALTDGDPATEDEPEEEPADTEAGDTDEATADAPEDESADGGSTQVRMQLSWIPDCQFAGYLQADEQGFYEDRNIDVEILPGGPNVNTMQQVVTGAAEFTVNKASALFAARDQGLPIVAVAQFDQESSFPLVAFAETGVQTPEDLVGKEVGIWYDGDEYEVLALLQQFDIDPDADVELFEQGFTMEPFLNGDYDVAMVTSFNELNVLYLEGVAEDELTVIDPSDHGITIPHGTLLANEEWVADNHDAASSFLEATIEGWQYAFDNPEETASFCAETSLAAGGEAATENLQELQERMLASMEELHFSAGYAEADHGRIDPAMFEDIADIVHEHGLIAEPADVEASFDPSVWESATGQ